MLVLPVVVCSIDYTTLFIKSKSFFKNVVNFIQHEIRDGPVKSPITSLPAAADGFRFALLFAAFESGGNVRGRGKVTTPPVNQLNR